MRISLLLFSFICFANSIHGQSFMRLRNLQLGPALSIQAKNQDGSIADLAPITKDPQHFPNWSPEDMDRRGWDFFRLKVPVGGHVSLLSTWDFYDRHKKAYSNNKEWKIGAEYTTFEHVFRSYKDKFVLGANGEKLSYQRKSQHLALYSDFVFKKPLRKISSFVYFGAGGYLSYTVSGKLEEKRVEYTEFATTLNEQYDHAANPRRDIGVVFPMGIELWGSKSVSRVGLNVGMRPGIVLIKEKMLPLFVSPVVGFTVRLVYNLH